MENSLEKNPKPIKTLGMRLSKAGSITSLVCAVHCALTPLALLALPVIAAYSSGDLHIWLGGILGTNN